MNDFTKEELQVIADGIPYVLHKDVNFRTALLGKIDSMIINYDEGSNMTPENLSIILQQVKDDLKWLMTLNRYAKN